MKGQGEVQGLGWMFRSIAFRSNTFKISKILLFLNYCFYYIELQDKSADNKHRKGKTQKNPNTKKNMLQIKKQTRLRQSLPNSLNQIEKSSCTIQYNKDIFQSKL